MSEAIESTSFDCPCSFNLDEGGVVAVILGRNVLVQPDRSSLKRYTAGCVENLEEFGNVEHHGKALQDFKLIQELGGKDALETSDFGFLLGRNDTEIFVWLISAYMNGHQPEPVVFDDSIEDDSIDASKTPACAKKEASQLASIPCDGDDSVQKVGVNLDMPCAAPLKTAGITQCSLSSMGTPADEAGITPCSLQECSPRTLHMLGGMIPSPENHGTLKTQRAIFNLVRCVPITPPQFIVVNC
jgi:hypothetical protein